MSDYGGGGGGSDDENYYPGGGNRHPLYAGGAAAGGAPMNPFQQMLGGAFGGGGIPLGMGGGLGGFAGFGGHHLAQAPPSAFKQSYKAFSSAIHEIQQGRGNQGAHVTDGGRTQVMFGGQIMMPPSALRHLTELDIEGPWTFELINPIKQSLRTHAGVLEFTADEGIVYLPSWMMKRLQLAEGDGIRLFGARLPKGKLVKLQPQSVTFLELSDPKAVLEQALRHYSCLSKDDIIEISYNMMTFSLLVMEIQPEGNGINILNTDLEVDFAAPVGYVEPERKPLAPAPTMASKLSINISQTQDVDSKGRSSGGANTPTGRASAAGGFSQGGGSTATAISKQGQAWEAFKGSGQSMAGKRIRGKGVSHRKIEEVESGSKIIRTSNVPRIVTADTQIGSRQVPAALNLPPGTLFFGFKYVPAKEGDENGDGSKERSNEGGVKPPAFTGAGKGVTLSGRAPRSSNSRSNASSQAPSRKPAGKQDPDVIEIDSD